MHIAAGELCSELAGVEDFELSNDEMMSHCLNFLFAAYDTTSLTLTCATYLLATNPHVQDKLCTLIDNYWDQNKVYAQKTTCTPVWHMI